MTWQRRQPRQRLRQRRPLAEAHQHHGPVVPQHHPHPPLQRIALRPRQPRIQLRLLPVIPRCHQPVIERHHIRPGKPRIPRQHQRQHHPCRRRPRIHLQPHPQRLPQRPQPMRQPRPRRRHRRQHLRHRQPRPIQPHRPIELHQPRPRLLTPQPHRPAADLLPIFQSNEPRPQIPDPPVHHRRLRQPHPIRQHQPATTSLHIRQRPMGQELRERLVIRCRASEGHRMGKLRLKMTARHPTQRL